MDIVCAVFLGEEEEAAEEEDDDDEEELQRPAPDGLSSSPGKTGPCGADTDGLSPGDDADSKGEAEMWDPGLLTRGLDLPEQSLITAVSGGGGGDCKADFRSALKAWRRCIGEGCPLGKS